MLTVLVGAEIATGQHKSRYHTHPSSKRRIAEKCTPEYSSTRTSRDDYFEHSVTIKDRKHPSSSTLSRVPSERQIDSSATKFPSTDKSLAMPPVTAIVRAPHSPTTSPPMSPLLVSKAEAIPAPQLPHPPLSLPVPGDDAALSKTLAMHDAIGYEHEHASGQKLDQNLEEEAQAVPNKQRYSTSHRKSYAEKTPADVQLQRPRSNSSSIEITSSLTASWVYVPRQASSTSASAISSTSSHGESVNDTAELCSSTVKDLSAAPPKSRSWRQGLSNAFQKMKDMVVGKESADSEKVQYAIGVDFKMYV